MQTRIERQRTQPRWTRAQHPTPVAAHLAQDDKLLLVDARDRGPRADVGQLLGEGVCALAAAALTDS